MRNWKNAYMPATAATFHGFIPGSTMPFIIPTATASIDSATPIRRIS